VRRVLFI